MLSVPSQLFLLFFTDAMCVCVGGGGRIFMAYFLNFMNKCGSFILFCCYSVCFMVQRCYYIIVSHTID